MTRSWPPSRQTHHRRLPRSPGGSGMSAKRAKERAAHRGVRRPPLGRADVPRARRAPRGQGGRGRCSSSASAARAPSRSTRRSSRGARTSTRIALDALSADDADVLLDRLGGTILESDQHTRIVEAAEGNPLFLEQLLALALEGGLGERPLPETIQALLAARLDRLGPGERAVLERCAVVGKEFTAEDVLSASRSGGRPDCRPASRNARGARLRAAARRGRVPVPPRSRTGRRLSSRAKAAAGRAARAVRRPLEKDWPTLQKSTNLSATTSSRPTGHAPSSASPTRRRQTLARDARATTRRSYRFPCPKARSDIPATVNLLEPVPSRFCRPTCPPSAAAHMCELGIARICRR